MTHSLANELLSMDAEADARYAARLAQREVIIQEAQQEAIKLIQRSVRERDTSREEAVREHDTLMHLKKDAMIIEARKQAQRITLNAQEQQQKAVEHIIAAIRGDTE